MNLYPAIDILEGKAVRLRQGRREEATVYGSPVEMAERWAEAGAGWLHVVDLEGAFEGRLRNSDAIRAIRKACPRVRIQTGGGVRDIRAVELLVESGADRVILGTAAVAEPALLDRALARFGEQIAVGVDARDGVVRLAGWTAEASLTAVELAGRVEQAGVELIVYTDIARDGELGGVNLEAVRAMLDATGLRVIASGGVADVEDIVRLKDLAHPRLEGVIIGKALYEGRLDLEDALLRTHAG